MISFILYIDNIFLCIMIQRTFNARVSHKTVYSLHFIFIALLQKIAIETRASVNNIVNETHYALC